MKSVLGGFVAVALLVSPAFAQSSSNKYTYDRGILVSDLGGEVTYKGFQVFLSFLF